MRRERVRGYHKPIMIAGGLGNVRRAHVEKAAKCRVGAQLVVLGGPAMLIGLGGGAASSVGSGSSSADLDFASVQRGNPEMQRRAQEVIDHCWALGERNPDRCSSTTSAPAVSPTPCPRRSRTARAARASTCAAIPSAESGMSPLELWCNEAQERYVLVIAAAALAQFGAIAARERCPFAVIGEIDASGQLSVARPAVPQRAGRHAARGAARQAAAPDARRRAASPPQRGRFDAAAHRSDARPLTACCACRRSPTRPSSSPSATARSAASSAATSSSAPGRCR